ncbi:MAG: AAA family ATPase [Bacteroidetes bacterium 4484_249]|nr:MAG: AAA family ATPase [Bacteroidetes bacterium 4484_249]
MLTDLLLQSKQIIESTDLKFSRYLAEKINWGNRLIAIKGARGSGKTTLILQHIAKNLSLNHTVLYISMEDLFFYNNTLVSLADEFILNGGKYLFLDEVHKYPDWAREIKLIYDKYKSLKIVFTSSSILEIQKAKYDLSRRAVEYYLKEMSLREYIALNSDIVIPKYGLNDILKNHSAISREITNSIKPVFEFNQYIRSGAYPFFIEGQKEYHQKLINTLNLILENDLPSVYNVDFNMVYKIKKLLYAVATSVPFKPNISKLSEKVGVSRPTLLTLLNYLEQAEIIYQLKRDQIGISSMAKPEKIFLHNTNLLYTLSENNFNIGNIRETFFINQLSTLHKVNYSEETDFVIDDKYYFEIGGKNKQQKQIKNLSNAFVVKDNIENGIANIIPLWLFGFLY